MIHKVFPPRGIEPRTPRSEVERAIHCATRAVASRERTDSELINISFSRLCVLGIFLISDWLKSFFFSIFIAWLWLVESLTLRWNKGQILRPKVKVQENRWIADEGDGLSQKEVRQCGNFQRILWLLHCLDSRQLPGTNGRNSSQ